MVAERNGVRGGTKLPPRVAESAPSGAGPARGRADLGGLSDVGARTSARERPGEATHDCSPHCQHCSLFASAAPSAICDPSSWLQRLPSPHPKLLEEGG